MEFEICDRAIEYELSISRMNAKVEEIIAGKSDNFFWFVEHPHVYTKGVSAHDSHLLQSINSIPVIPSDRGGKYTYHGPGQRIVYCMVDLNKYFLRDIGHYVCEIEELIVAALAHFGISAVPRYQGSVGVWAITPDVGLAKISSIGIKVKKWVAWHGFALNINTDLKYYDGIIPCGIEGAKMTSMEAFGYTGGYGPVDAVIIQLIKQRFLVTEKNCV